MNDHSNQQASTEKIQQTATSPGPMLRKLREKAGLDPATVGEALHLTAHYVKALENDDYAKLPCLTFIKGYLRSYALYLRTDVNAVLASFELHLATLANESSGPVQVYHSHRPQDQSFRWAIAGGIALVIGLSAGWWFGLRDAGVAGVDGSVGAGPGIAEATVGQSASARAADVIDLSDTATDMVDTAGGAAREVSLVANGNDMLQLIFNGSSWVEIDDSAETRLYNDVLRAGDALTVQGEAPFHVLLGNARHVEVTLNAAPVDFAADIRADSSARLVLDNKMLAAGDVH